MKRRFGKHTLLLSAVIVTISMVFTSFGLLTLPTYAEGDQVDAKICFDGDSAYDWAHFYSVDGKEGALSEDELNITVQDGGGNPIDPAAYDLSVDYTYYDEENETEVRVPMAEGPYGITEADRDFGYSEYIATATFKEGSGYEGSTEGSFIISDKYSLLFVCADIQAQGFAESTGWRMHDRYIFKPGVDIDIKVRHSGTKDWLTEGSDYSVTYYRLSHPDQMDNQEYDFKDFLVSDAEHRVEGVPTEKGTYFAKIEGIDPYYGEADIIIDIDDTGRIKLESDDHEIWSDDELVYDVTLPEGMDGTLEFYGGIKNGNDWDLCMTGNEFFEYDAESGTVTMKGPWIYNTYSTVRRDGPFRLEALLKNDGKIVAKGEADAWMREAVYDYDLPRNSQMLPQWEQWINAAYNVWIENKDYPEGQDIDLGVKSVRLENASPADVLTLSGEEGLGWSYEANKPGSADIVLTYDDYDGTEKEHRFNVNVSDTVYRVDMWSADGEFQGLPGTSIELEASAVKQTAKPDRDNPKDWNHNESSDGLEYSWSLGKGSEEWATLTAHRDDPSKATLTFKDMPEGWDQIGESVDVCVEVFDKNSDDPSKARGERWEDFYVSDRYYTIAPGQIDSSLDLWKTDTITPEVRFYRYGTDGYTTIDAAFRFENYDYNVFESFDDNGDGTYSYTRRGHYGTNIRLVAEWNEDGRDMSVDRWYRIDDKNYEIRFPYNDTDIYNDQNDKIELEKNDLDNLIDEIDDPNNDYYRIDYTVGTWNDEEDKWGEILGTEYYEADSSGITLDYAKIKERGINRVRVNAELYLAEEHSRCSADVWVNLRNACLNDEHHWIKGAIKQATCQEKGKEIWVCLAHHLWEGCGEIRVVETDIVPHDLTKVAAKEATVNAEGSKAHYRCKMCGKLFGDAEAANEISPESIIVAKKIDIANASVAKIADVKYNKKAQTPALTVKMGAATLNAGTDYSVKYSGNTNVGTAKVTVTGLGKYGGSKETSFKIVKANNPAKFTAKAVSIKYSAVSKKNQTVKQASACTVTGAQGKVTWKKASGNAKITMASNGNITVKKGIKKGTYKLVANATAAGNSNYNKVTKKVTITIKVK